MSTRWLSADQQRSWRAYIAATTLLSDRLSRELQSAHKLTLSDYEILVRLSEAPDRRLRMSELADYTLSSRSRLSHQIDRLEDQGIVERQACETDRRGANAVLTDKGFDLLVEAAPTHVDGVRKHLVDLLTDEQFAALGSALAVVAEHLQSPDCDEQRSA
ncbi:MAG: MarR family transcriptional regulator [Actinobacteria bacterium]|jgi:DNA-binding MarR family transcriptional regulator|nr:MarR family transcriptional regulator [Actinomycetota bacterium]